MKTTTMKSGAARIFLLMALCLAATLGSARADGTLSFWGPTFEDAEANNWSNVYVQRTGGSTGAVDITYSTANGTAVAGQDYTTTVGTLSWADGETGSKSFHVPIINDSIQENTETVNITLSNPTGGAILGSQSTTVLNIIDNDHPAILSFWGPTFEDAEANNWSNVYVQRTGGSGGAVSVQYATSNGTAVAGQDYTATSGTLSWADGETGSKSFHVPIINDSIQENTETVNITLSNPTNRAIVGAQSTTVLNIVDNDQAAILQFWGPTFEDAEANNWSNVYVQRTGGSGGAVSVQYSTANGTAVAGQDYTATSGTLSWADGETGSKSFHVPVIDDALGEAMETVNIALSSPTGGAVLGGQSTTVLNIADNDQSAILEFWAPTFEVNESTGTVNIYVQRTGGSGGAVSVQYATSNGTAVAGQDYTAATGTLNWADGETNSKSFAIPIANDGVTEGTETVNLALSTPSAGAVLGTQKNAVLNITNNAAGAIRFGLANYSVNENAGTATISVERTGGSSGAVSVQYSTTNGTAVAGQDYTTANGTLSWVTGESGSKSFTVPITNDALVEGNETVNLTLSNVTGGAGLSTPTSSVLTILDGATGTLQFSLANFSVNENTGTASISVKRTGGSVGAVTVQYATSDRIALAGQDYSTSTGTLSWANGDAADKTFTVPIINDTVGESSEALNLTLINPTGGAVLGAQNTALLTIIDDDSGRLQFSVANYSVNENGVTATIRVTRTSGSGGAVSVQYATSNGTATAGQDYTAATGTLNWANGDAADKTFTVSITNDALVEGNETINLSLSNPTGGATLGAQTTALLTILDGASGALQFSLANYSVNENGGTATISVKRTGGSVGAVTVQYTTGNGTAVAPGDYTPKFGTLSWAAGDTADKTFSVPIISDAIVEASETVNLVLTGPTGGATLGTQSMAVLNIVNVNADVVQFGAPTYSVNEAGTTATITVTRTGSGSAIRVTYAASNGTAGSTDYTPITGYLNWASNDTAPKTFTVTIANDTAIEGDETINLTLSSPTGGASLGARSNAVLVIADNDAPAAGALQFGSPTFSVSESGTTATITVTRTGGSSGAISVAYSTKNGTAIGGTDYANSSGTLSWAAGETAPKTFTISIIGDSIAEGDETIKMSLSNATNGAVVGTVSTAVVTILDNDAGVLQFGAPTFTVDESGTTITVTVTRVGGSSGAVSVQFASSNGTAVGGSDFIIANGTLSWASGDMSAKTFTITIANDTTAEVNETFSVLLTNVTGGAILGSQKVVVLTIADNDDLLGPTLTIASPSNNATISSLTSITGTMSDSGVGNENLAVVLMRISDGLYWNGTTWVPVTSPHLLYPTRSTNTWSLNTGLPPLAQLTNGNYIISAAGTDRRCNIGNAVAFITVNKAP